MTTPADTPETGSDGGPTSSGRAHRAVPRMSMRVLLDGAQAGPGAADGIGSVQVRASATLYGLLMDHPIDRQGRLPVLPTPGAFERRRRCWVHVHACHWLHHPDIQFLPSQLANEFGLASTGAAATKPDDTDVLSAIAADPVSIHI